MNDRRRGRRGRTLALIAGLVLAVAATATLVLTDQVPLLRLAVGRAPKARTSAEGEFLALGEGASLWLTEAAAAGTTRMRVKMAAAVATAFTPEQAAALDAADARDRTMAALRERPPSRPAPVNPVEPG